MKPKDGIESLTNSWNRYVEIHKRSIRMGNPIPVKVRGYSELAMIDLSQRERKKMHSAVMRGYRLAYSDRPTQLLNMMLKEEDFSLGYIGKTNAQVWLPTKAERDECMKHVEAMAVMTEKFNASRSIRLYSDRTFNIWVNTNTWDNEQLKSHFTEIRAVVDEYMVKYVDQRKSMADKIMDDQHVCRIPFTSKGD